MGPSLYSALSILSLIHPKQLPRDGFMLSEHPTVWEFDMEYRLGLLCFFLTFCLLLLVGLDAK